MSKLFYLRGSWRCLVGESIRDSTFSLWICKIGTYKGNSGAFCFEEFPHNSFYNASISPKGRDSASSVLQLEGAPVCKPVLGRRGEHSAKD